MIKSTALAGTVELQSSPTAYYLWEFPEKPISVRVSLDVVDGLERDILESFRAITARGSEVGGLLLGRSEGGSTVKTIVDNYELFPCDYTRGPLYLLSDEEKVRLEDVIRRKKAVASQGGAVVGFFRSNTRKDLSLDEEDLDIFREYFSRPEQAFLLVKPFAAKASTAGIFIWEDGKVRNEGSYIEFPFRRSELGKGDFARSIVLDTPKPKEAPAEPAAPAAHKTGSRAPVLPFSLKRDEEPPVAAPPLKKEERERTPVVALAPKPEPKPEPVAVPVPPRVVEAAPVAVEPKPAVEPPVVRKTAEKVPPAAPAPRDETRAVKEEGKKETAKQETAATQVKPAAKAPAAAAAAVGATALAPAPNESFTAAPLPERSGFGGKKLWALFGGLILLGVAGGTLAYLHSRSAEKAELSARDAGSLQLKAEHSGTQLMVRWNRYSNPIQMAQSAVLSIRDGAKTEDVPLDLTQLHAGSIMYSPLSGDVSFRLEVKDNHAATTRSEFVRAPAAANDTAQSPSLQAQLTPTADLPEQQKPSPADAGRADAAAQPNAAEEAEPPARPAAPAPKPFSLAARIRQPEASDLPEAPSVDPSAPSSMAIRPGTPSRLPAPAPPPPQAQPAQPAPAPAVPPTPLRVGGKVQEPKLIRRVDAVYPPMARQARVAGVVRIQATIGADGKVKKLAVRSGPPLLRQAAIDAVQRWVYSPSLLNGSPVEATTDVEVNFNFGAQ